ncbi:MAG: imidazole glycerol phosphate synthase subunit HisH [Planctomycetales bacterium]
MITIVDYGMGNLRSVQKAFETLGVDAKVTSSPQEVAQATKLVLPGVGAFRDAIAELKRQDLVSPILDHVAAEKPFLGICLGLQLLFDVSYEDGEWKGLGIVPGEVVRFREVPGFKVPHMGWNQLQVVGEPALLAGIPRDAHFYFVHSYYVVPKDPAVIAARTDYIDPVTAMIQRGNLMATQFHPEKSQQVGLKLLKNFAAM